MSEKTEITFMQTRLIRLASEEWHLPVEQIIHLFKEADVLGYILMLPKEGLPQKPLFIHSFGFIFHQTASRFSGARYI